MNKLYEPNIYLAENKNPDSLIESKRSKAKGKLGEERNKSSMNLFANW